MGGFSIEDPVTKRYLGGLNLPCRNVFFSAIAEAGQMERLEHSVICACADCIYSEVNIADWIEACTYTLVWLEQQPENWSRGKEANWSSGESDKQVALNCLRAIIRALKRAKGDTAIIHDEFMMCEHKRIIKNDEYQRDRARTK